MRSTRVRGRGRPRGPGGRAAAFAAVGTAAMVILLGALAVQSIALPAGCQQSGSKVTCYYPSGASGLFTVPAGVHALDVVAVGGAGAGPGDPRCDPLCGGSPAQVSATLDVSPGQQLNLEVATDGNILGVGGTPGGGNGCNGRGGATVVSDHASNQLMLLAAGGGGNGCPGSGAQTNDPGGFGGDAAMAGAGGGNAVDGAGGQAGTSGSPGNGGAGGFDPAGDGAAGQTPPPGTLHGGAGGQGAISASLPGAAGGEGGGGGAGLYGGGGGGGGAVCPGDNCVSTFAGGGGGGGGASLVPAGGSLSTTGAEASLTITYNIVSFTSPAPPAGTVGAP